MASSAAIEAFDARPRWIAGRNSDGQNQVGLVVEKQCSENNVQKNYPTSIHANMDTSNVPVGIYHTRVYARICMISLLTCGGTRNRYWITLGREVFGQGTVSELASPVLPRLAPTPLPTCAAMICRE